MSLLKTYTDEEKLLLSGHKLTSDKHSQISDAFVLGYRCNKALTETLRLKELENQQLAQDKAELRGALKTAIAVIKGETEFSCEEIDHYKLEQLLNK